MVPKSLSKLIPGDWLTAEIDQDGVEAVLKPVFEICEAPISRPCYWNAIPAIQLLFKNLLAPPLQMLARLFFGIVLRKQVDRWFQPQIVQAEVRTRWIRLMQPVQERLGWYDSDC
jgi:hypothetical protein